MPKKCPKCSALKSVDNFYKNKSKKDGLNSWCKVCYKKHNHTKHARRLNCIGVKKYAMTDKGRVSRKRADIKRAKTEARHISWSKKQTRRRKNLEWNILFDNLLDEEIEWHHISNDLVVAIPKDIHKLYTGYDLKIHRELCMNVINQIYLGGK